MIAVERLRPAMQVLTTSGEAVPITWLGHREVDSDHHPEPWTVWPVRVRAGAFDDAMPLRDLWLSPDHAVYMAGALIPIRHLINGTTIVQQSRSRIAYWHVELSHHDIILAEGLPVESYLETGGRAAFANGGGVVSLHPDFATRVWEAEGCAQLVVTGAELAVVRARLAARVPVQVAA